MHALSENFIDLTKNEKPVEVKEHNIVIKLLENRKNRVWWQSDDKNIAYLPVWEFELKIQKILTQKIELFLLDSRN